MKNRCVAFALALIFVFSLTGCAERSVPDSPAQSLSPVSDTALTSQASLDISAANKSDAPALPPGEGAIEAGLKNAVDACDAVFYLKKIPSSPERDQCAAAFPQDYFSPTRDEYERMKKQVAMLGMPVCAPDSDMQNYEQVVEFFKNTKAGKDAHITVYSIRNFDVYSYTFVSNGGKISCTLSSSGLLQRGLYYIGQAVEVDSLELTSGGHLLYSLVADGGNEPSSGGFCVLPHGEELRSLCRTYIDPIGYGAGGALTVNWDENDLSRLNWEFLFEQLNFHSTGKSLPEAFTAPYHGDENRLAVPASEVESVLQSFFPVSTETLHSLKRYDAEREVYAWQGFSGGGYKPTPEVTALAENPDGSITLTVGALALEWGKEYTFTSQITIMPRSDGSFQYLSGKTDSTMRAWEND